MIYTTLRNYKKSVKYWLMADYHWPLKRALEHVNAHHEEIRFYRSEGYVARAVARMLHIREYHR